MSETQAMAGFAAEQVVALDLEVVRESPLNTRRHWNPAKQKELEESIRGPHGIIQPLLVRPQNGDATSRGMGLRPHYEIGSGHRRFRAAKTVGLKSVPAIVREMDDAAFLELINIENLLREDLHPLDEANGFRNLLEKAGYDVQALAARVGKSDGYIYQRLKLCELIDKAQEAFLEDKITTAHALQIARLQPKDQAAALGACFREIWLGGKQEKVLIPASALTKWIRQEVLLDLKAAPFSTTDANLHPTAGACVDCPKRTGFKPALFPELAKKEDFCTDAACFRQKVETHIHVHIESRKKLEVPVVQLSELYRTKAGVLGAREWTELAGKKDRCDHLVQGIVVEGDRDVGRVKDVCVDPKCPKHGDRHGGILRDAQAEARRERERKTAEAKLKAERVFRNRVLDAILEKAPAPLAGEELRIVAGGLFHRMWSDRQREVAKRRGWTEKDRAGSHTYNDAAARFLAAASDQQVVGFLLETILVGLTDPGSHYAGAGTSHNSSARAELLTHAKRYQVNVGAIERELAARAREKAAKVQTKIKAGKKVQKKAAVPARAGRSKKPKGET